MSTFEQFYKKIEIKKTITNWEITPLYEILLRTKLQNDYTFKNCFRRDLTKTIHQELHHKAYGKMPSHFVIFIRGLTGVDTSTGTLKSSAAIELMMMYDEKATSQHISWSNDQLLLQIQQLQRQNKEHTIYLRDETPETLRVRSNIEFNTVKESIRAESISFILVKPEIENISASTIILEPMYHTPDLQYLKLAIYKQEVGYLGYMLIKIHLNNPIWQEYEPLKKEYIKQAINRQTNKTEYKDYAIKFIQSEEFQKCIIGHKYNKLRINRYLEQKYPNLTHQERRFIADSIKEIVDSGEIDQYLPIEKQ